MIPLHYLPTQQIPANALGAFADSVWQISNSYPNWRGPPAKLQGQLRAILGRDYMNRSPKKIREFVTAPLVQEHLSRRNLQIRINDWKQLEIRRL